MLIIASNGAILRPVSLLATSLGIRLLALSALPIPSALKSGLNESLRCLHGQAEQIGRLWRAKCT